jgi:hypothetical protein
MGSDTIPDRANGNIIDEDWFDVIQRALKGDLIPRNSSGVAEDIAGSLGSATYWWKKAFIKSGYWTIGDYKFHQDYNGLCTPGQGWMLVDGRIINQANYDAEHGAGSWAIYVGSTILDGRYLDNAVGCYAVGVDLSPAQDGTIAFTHVGNTSHQVNLAHTHSYSTGGGNWYKGVAGADDQVLSGGLVGYSNVTKGTAKSFLSVLVGNSTTINGILGAGTVGPLENADVTAPRTPVVASSSTTTGSGSSATQNIQPESFQAQVYMRIIE